MGKMKRTKKKVKKEEDRVKVKLVLEPEDGEKEKKVDFNLEVEVDPDSPGKEPLTTHLEGQVEGKEMDVEMQGKTKADGEVGLAGSIQQGKERDSNSSDS